MSAMTCRPDWADEYPDFYHMLMNQFGNLEYVDDLNVPFYSAISYVTLKQKHFLFSESARASLMAANAQDEELKAFYDKYDSTIAEYVRMAAGSPKPEWVLPQPVNIPKDLYVHCRSKYVKSFK